MLGSICFLSSTQFDFIFSRFWVIKYMNSQRPVFLVYIDVFWLHILWFKHTWSKCFPWIDQNISLRLSVFPKNHSLFSPFYEHTLTVFEKLQQGNNGSWIKKILLLKDLIKSRKSGPKNKATKMSKMAEDISCHHVFSSG